MVMSMKTKRTITRSDRDLTPIEALNILARLRNELDE